MGRDDILRKRIYKRTKSNYPYDDYSNQEVIIYDDFWPELGEILHMSNCYNTLTPVWGPTRYGKKYLKMKQRRVMLFFSNEQPPYTKASFDARFTVIELKNSN